MGFVIKSCTIKILLVLGLAITPLLSWGQSGWEDLILGEAEGLPQKEIYNCIEDDEHRIYVATDQGVYRIHGNEVKRYTSSDGLGSNTVFQLFKDLQGRIWATCSEGGIQYLSGEKWITPTFIHSIIEDYSLDNFPYKLVFTEDNFVYVQSFHEESSLHEVNLKDSSVFRIEIPSTRTQPRPLLYALLENDSILLTGRTKLFAEIDNPLLKDRARNLSHSSWFHDTVSITSPRGSFEVTRIGTPKPFDSSTGPFRIFSNFIDEDSSYIFNHNEYTLRQDQEGRLTTLAIANLKVLDAVVQGSLIWIATLENGLFLYQYDNGHTTLVSHQLRQESISDLFIDSRNNLWVSVTHSGLARIPLPCWTTGQIDFEHNDISLPLHFTSDTSAIGIHFNNAYLFTNSQETNYGSWEIANKYPLIGMIGVQKRYNHITRTGDYLSFKNFIFDLSRPEIPVINWTGADISTHIFHRTRYSKLSETGKTLHSVIKPHAVSIYDKGTLDTLQNSRYDDLEINGFTLKGDSIDFLATNHGIFKRVNKEIVPAYYNLLDFTSIHKAPYGWTLGLAKSEGLLLFNEDTAFRITEDNFLIDHFQSTIYADDQFIYAASNTSFFIARINEQGIEDYYHYFYDEIPGLSAISHFTRFQDKLVLFDRKKMFSIPIGKLKASSRNFGCHISWIRVNGVKRELEAQNLLLERGENSIEIHLTPNTPFPRDGSLFLWKVRPEDEWQESSDGEITLVNLSDGSYDLIVKYRDERGQWTEETALFSCVVRLPLIQTMWFWGLISSPVMISLLYFNYTSRKRKTLNKELIESNMTSLKMQINPHFIFNAFNSIQYLIIAKKNETANEYLSRLAKLIRKTIARPDLHRISLQEELDYIKEFMTIERMRLDNSFEFEINLDEEVSTTDSFIPPMILQPLLENSIWHGVSHLDGYGKIEIQISVKKEVLLIHILDNGSGFPRELWNQLLRKEDIKGSLGLRNVMTRLELLSRLYERKYRLELSPTEFGTHFTLTIPL